MNKVILAMSSILLSVILVLGLVQLLLADLDWYLDTQVSSIESGFEKEWHSLFFSSPFFFLAALFVLFDVELILLMPSIFCLNQLMEFIMNSTTIVMIVSMTLMVEWWWAGLKWQV